MPFHTCIFLRMCLTLTPSNAQVESAFSRLDAENWFTYDVRPIVDRMQRQVRRASFRLARADKGEKGGPSGKKEKGGGAKRKKALASPICSSSADHCSSSSDEGSDSSSSDSN